MGERRGIERESVNGCIFVCLSVCYMPDRQNPTKIPEHEEGGGLLCCGLCAHQWEEHNFGRESNFRLVFYGHILTKTLLCTSPDPY